MLKTKILLSAQADKLTSDITEIRMFFTIINDCYVDRSLYFNLVIDDNTTGDTEIADCALALFLIEYGAELPKTYKAAINSYNKTGRPRIFTYVKTQELGVRGQELGNVGYGSNSQISIFNSQLTSRPYTHIDTLKLDILMQIKQLGLDGVDIHLEDGKAWQGSTALLSIENIEAVSGYENLQNLKQRHAELESRYYAAKARCAENPDDADAYDALFEASKQRAEAIQEIRDVEAQLYHMMEGMYEQTSRGKLTARQAEGYRLIERGMLNEARAVLDFNEIVSESRHTEELAEQASKRAQDTVNELMQLKDVSATLLDWDAVDACYKEAVKLEEKHNLPRKAFVDYVEFLRNHNRQSEAIDLGEKLCRVYEDPETDVSDEDKSLLYNFLGVIYSESNHMQESEDYLKASLRIRQARTDGDPDVISKDIAIVYNNLGNLYWFQNRLEDAADAHKSALEIRKVLAVNNPDAYEEYLGYTYANLGGVYDDMRNCEESVDLTSMARDIFKRLAATKSDPYEEYLSVCYENLGAAYANLQRFEEAEDVLKAALEIRTRWVENNPDSYEPLLADTYYEYGNLCLKARRYSDAEEKYTAAIKLYVKLTGRNPDAFTPCLAKCYSCMGELFNETERFPEAVNALSTSAALYDKYSEANPACAEKAAEARKILVEIKNEHHNPSARDEGLTPEEQEIALLLTEGLSQREIVRKLKLSATEVSGRIEALRGKVSGTAGRDPVIAIVAGEYKLTKREMEILYYLGQNAENDELASELFLSVETVRGHVRNLLKKIPVKKRQDISEWLSAYPVNNTGK